VLDRKKKDGQAFLPVWSSTLGDGGEIRESYIDSDLEENTAYVYRLYSISLSGIKSEYIYVEAETFDSYEEEVQGLKSIPLDSLILWVSAETAPHAGRISMLNDLSGSGNIAAQPLPLRRPAIQEYRLNGRKALLTFVSGNQYGGYLDVPGTLFMGDTEPIEEGEFSMVLRTEQLDISTWGNRSRILATFLTESSGVLHSEEDRHYAYPRQDIGPSVNRLFWVDTFGWNPHFIPPSLHHIPAWYDLYDPNFDESAEENMRRRFEEPHFISSRIGNEYAASAHNDTLLYESFIPTAKFASREQMTNKLGDSLPTFIFSSPWNRGGNLIAETMVFNRLLAIEERAAMGKYFFFKYRLEGGPYFDLDEDCLPDWWELYQWGDIFLYGPEDDPDYDGLTNIQEFDAGTDPTVAETGTDLDLDGLPNADEIRLSEMKAIAWGGRALNVANWDTNSSLVSDWVSIQLGWDPTAENSSGSGYTNLLELDEGWDPYLEDTDDDGVNDDADDYPLDPTRSVSPTAGIPGGPTITLNQP
jgi:hypothetical protein